MPHMHLAGKVQGTLQVGKTLDKLGVLLAVSTTHDNSPMTHLMSESGPETLHPCFKHV